MTNLLTILVVLFVALLVIVPMVERFAPRPTPEQTQRMSRWILPLVGLSLIIALIKQLMG